MGIIDYAFRYHLWLILLAYKYFSFIFIFDLFIYTANGVANLFRSEKMN